MKRSGLFILFVAVLFAFVGCETLSVDDSVLRRAGTGVRDTASGVAQWTDRTSGDVASAVENAFENTVENVETWVSEKVEKAEEVTENVVYRITEEVTETAQAVSDTGNQVAETVKKGANTVSDVFNNIGKQGTQTEQNPESEKKSSDKLNDITSVNSGNPIVSTENRAESSNFVLVVILIAIGLIGIAIAYYCISIRKENRS